MGVFVTRSRDRLKTRLEVGMLFSPTAKVEGG